MRFILVTVALTLSICSSAAGQVSEPQFDSNAAFFEGADFNYILYPPDGFKLVVDEALSVGYSLAFVPENQSYDSANVVINVNIFRLKDKKADSDFLLALISDDTSQVKKHYGAGLRIWPVDSVFNADKKLMPTYYFDDTSRFIPTVMMSYFNGTSEIIIYELNITQLQPRFKAEQSFTDCLDKFRTLIKGDIEERNKRLREGG